MTLTQILQKIRNAFYTKKEIDSMGGGTSLSDTISGLETKANAITGLSVSGKVITYTKGNGTTGTITTQDTNTTYSFSNKAATLSWNTTSTIATVGGVDITVKLPANPNNSSGNGWIRFDDGTQICTGTTSSITLSPDEIKIVSATFPKSFSSVPEVITCSTNPHIIAATWGISKTGCEVYLKSTSTGTGTNYGRYIAFGKWK